MDVSDKVYSQWWVFEFFFKLISDNYLQNLADACFKAASNMIRDFPATLEIDGRTINTESILVSYIKQMLSILLVVPVIIFESF